MLISLNISTPIAPIILFSSPLDASSNKSNSASIRGSQFGATTAPLDFFDSIKLKELRLVIKKISLADSDAFTLGFQTLTTRKLDFGDTMGPLETVTTIITDEDFT